MLITIYVNVCMKRAYPHKQTITSCSFMEQIRRVNFPSNDRVCDDRIRHLNLKLIVPSTKVNNLPFWNFQFSHVKHTIKAGKLCFYFYQILPAFNKWKKSLKIPKGQLKSVYRRRTDNTMAKRKSTNNDQHYVIGSTWQLKRV